GTILVMDPHTGQLLAVVNPRLATRQAFPPGSTIKPFLALAALESGRIQPTETWRCQGGERRESRNLLCSHRPFASPLTLTQALAHSCNDYFLALGERLGEGATLGYLRGWGFGEPTGWGAGESAGRLPQTGWSREGALGTEAELLVTPLQLLRAYQGIVNEGQLCRPSEHALACEAVRRVPLTERHRLDILRGLQAAVREGTATAALPDLSRAAKDRMILYGKTGTSAASNQFRTQGWFVGLLSWRSASTSPEGIAGGSGTVRPVRRFPLAVLVFLKRASGADAAAVARPLLADLAEGILATPASLSEVEPSGMGDRAEGMVRLGPTRGGAIVRLPLERYLSGVLQGEAGHETELEALKAQAVVSRTFAIGNLGRHAADGYDFCRTTHCQAYQGRPEVPPLIRRALLATRGELLGGGRQRSIFTPLVGGGRPIPRRCGEDQTPPRLIYGG
ncbi:MAG: penicillin-binding transpeptidase domain-containing protein, partial [Blastocatellia bacterium]